MRIPDSEALLDDVLLEINSSDEREYASMSITSSIGESGDRTHLLSLA